MQCSPSRDVWMTNFRSLFPGISSEGYQSSRECWALGYES